VRIHREISKIADNAVLDKMLSELEKRSNWYRGPFEPTNRRRAWEEHEAIVAAIVAGDAEAAMSIISAHIDHAREHLYESITPA
jgi:DNA-binding GntR family transcriptional regulator